MRHDRNAEPRLFAQELLEPIEPAHALRRIDGPAPQRSGDLAEPMVEHALQRFRISCACEFVGAHLMVPLATTFFCSSQLFALGAARPGFSHVWN